MTAMQHIQNLSPLLCVHWSLATTGGTWVFSISKHSLASGNYISFGLVRGQQNCQQNAHDFFANMVLQTEPYISFLYFISHDQLYSYTYLIYITQLPFAFDRFAFPRLKPTIDLNILPSYPDTSYHDNNKHQTLQFWYRQIHLGHAKLSGLFCRYRQCTARPFKPTTLVPCR